MKRDDVANSCVIKCGVPKWSTLCGETVRLLIPPEERNGMDVMKERPNSPSALWVGRSLCLKEAALGPQI